MQKVALLLAEGFETVEALTVVDVLRRAGVGITMVSTMDSRKVLSGQQILIHADLHFNDVNFDEYEWLVIPGGLPAVKRLAEDQRVLELVKDFALNKHVAAICAGPSILNELSLIQNIKFTCYPNTIEGEAEKNNQYSNVCQDKNIITAKSMPHSLEFALCLLEQLADEQTVERVKNSLYL